MGGQLATLSLGMGKMRGWSRNSAEHSVSRGFFPSAPPFCSWEFRHRHIGGREITSEFPIQKRWFARKAVGEHTTNVLLNLRSFLYIFSVFPLRFLTHLSATRLSITQFVYSSLNWSDSIPKASPICPHLSFFQTQGNSSQIPANTLRGPLQPPIPAFPLLHAFPCRAHCYTHQHHVLLLNERAILHAVTDLSTSSPSHSQSLFGRILHSLEPSNDQQIFNITHHH